MPVFKSGVGNAPAWGALDDFEFIALKSGEEGELEKKEAKEAFVLCRGHISTRAGGVDCSLTPGSWFAVDNSGSEVVGLRANYFDALVMRATGRWTSITSAGLFDVWTTTPPTHDTPYSYEKTTRFDNHYHDLDEYWMVYEGQATVASEGKLYKVGPGDCVATGMGWHHDVVTIHGEEKMQAVYFEGGKEGKGRTGHLWEPTHGKAEPQLDRV